MIPVAISMATPQNHSVPEVNNPHPKAHERIIPTKATADDGSLLMNASTMADNTITTGNM